jgi:DNA mismatch repair ATPase MutS
MRASNSVIVAITEGRGVASEIGLAWIDLITVECGLTQVVKEIKL